MHYFLEMYSEMATGRATKEDINFLFDDIKKRLPENFKYKGSFEVESHLDKTVAIDAVAHSIHQGDEQLLFYLYPEVGFQIASRVLNKLANKEGG